MPKDNLTILGERLRAARNKANLTQEQLSDRSHVSIKHIAGIETSLDKGTQRKTTENELPSLTQCTA